MCRLSTHSMNFLLLNLCRFAILVPIVLAYNFNTDNVIVYEDVSKHENSRNSYFGFSVALVGKNSLGESLIYIGAPRANVSDLNDVIEPGVVFSCKIGQPCSRLRLENDNAKEQDKYPSHYSWIGATIGVYHNEDPQIVVCGPRWRSQKPPKDFKSSVFAISDFQQGICYIPSVKKDSSGWEPLEPFHGIPAQRKSDNLTIPLRVTAQAGFSIAMDPNNFSTKFMIGAPAFYERLGAASLYQPNDFVIHEHAWEGNQDNMYFGYAVTFGWYVKKYGMFHASGGPRSKDLYGSVAVYSYSTENDVGMTLYSFNWNMKGDQLGEYYGASLASCKITGNKTKELVVGSPFWVKNNSTVEEPDSGRIIVHTEGKGNKLIRMQEIVGEVVGGRFGEAITCLGDIDADGFADLAVGAPYEGNGVVYVFYGSKTGLNVAHRQKLVAPENARGFGISISVPQDIDENGFADIAVGAYSSGHAVVFRSKIIVELNITLNNFTIVSGPDPHYKYFVLEVCTTYKAVKPVPVPKLKLSHKLNFIGTTGAVKLENYTDVAGEIENIFCETFKIAPKKKSNIDDAQPSLSASVSWTDEGSNKSTLIIKRDTTHGSDFFNRSAVVVREDTSRLMDSQPLPSLFSCKNETCQDNLTVHLTTDLDNGNVYTIGTMPTIKLFISVANTGEDAYDIRTNIRIPAPLTFVASNSTNCMKSLINTDRNAHIDDLIMECHINSVLPGSPNNLTKIIYIELGTSQITHPQTISLITKTVTSGVSASGVEQTLDIVSEMDINIDFRGESKPEVSPYIHGTSEIIQFRHIYTIQNHGRSPVKEAKLSISVPTYWNENELFKIDSENLRANCKPVTRFSGSKMDDINSTNLISCDHPSVKCDLIECLLGPLIYRAHIELVEIPFEVLTSDSPFGHEDEVKFETRGNIKIRTTDDSFQNINGSSDTNNVYTIFVKRTPPEALLAPWIIPTSILTGLLLVCCLGFFLKKYGFFAREKKKALEKLQQQANLPAKIILETTSSTQTLSCD